MAQLDGKGLIHAGIEQNCALEQRIAIQSKTFPHPNAPWRQAPVKEKELLLQDVPPRQFTMPADEDSDEHIECDASLSLENRGICDGLYGKLCARPELPIHIIDKLRLLLSATVNL